MHVCTREKLWRPTNHRVNTPTYYVPCTMYVGQVGFVESVYTITVATWNYVLLLFTVYTAKWTDCPALCLVLSEGWAVGPSQDVAWARSKSQYSGHCKHINVTIWLLTWNRVAGLHHWDCVMSLIELLTFLWNWQDGLTPLMKAAAVGHEESTKLILQNICRVNLQENVGFIQ